MLFGPDNFVIVLDESGKINQRIDNVRIENRNLVKTLIEKDKSVPDVINNLVEFKGLSVDLEDNFSNKQIIYMFKDDIVTSKISNTIITFNYRDMLFYKNEIKW